MEEIAAIQNIQIKFNAPLVLGFALVSLAALVLNKLTMGKANQKLFSVYRCPASDPLAGLRFFTHVLGHSNLNHYMNNMLLFLLIGPTLEERYGPLVLGLCIAVTALATGLVEFIFFPKYALLGASGVVFMMIVLSSFTGAERGVIPVTLILVTVLYLGREIVNGVTDKDNVSQLAHIIGGVCGLVLGYLLHVR